MTLGLAYVDEIASVHVADRRLSRWIGNGYETASEDAVKACIVRGSLLISFAGLAEVQGLTTPRWIESHLEASTNELRATLESIAGTLTSVFHHERYVDALLTVTITGWAVNEQELLTAIIGTITNQDPTDLRRLNVFHSMAAPLHMIDPNGRADWVSTGRLSEKGRSEINQAIGELTDTDRTASAIARIFSDQVRVEAGRDLDQTIGQSLRIAILPVDALQMTVTEGGSELDLGYNANGHYTTGLPMIVDLPAGKGLQVHPGP